MEVTCLFRIGKDHNIMNNSWIGGHSKNLDFYLKGSVSWGINFLLMFPMEEVISLSESSWDEQ